MQDTLSKLIFATFIIAFEFAKAMNEKRLFIHRQNVRQLTFCSMTESEKVDLIQLIIS